MYKSMLITIMKYRWNTDGFPQSMQKRKKYKTFSKDIHQNRGFIHRNLWITFIW